MKENNILLSEFLGWEEVTKNKNRFKATHPYYISVTEHDYDFRTETEIDIFETSFDDMKFHNDWNWLMLVVHKCLSIAHEEMLNEWENSFADVFLADSIDTMYKEVVEFVKWYNENK